MLLVFKLLLCSRLNFERKAPGFHQVLEENLFPGSLSAQAEMHQLFPIRIRAWFDLCMLQGAELDRSVCSIMRNNG